MPLHRDKSWANKARMPRRLSLVLPVFAALLAGAVSLWPTLAQNNASLWKPGECPFAIPDGEIEGETLGCGSLHVPEDRRNPASPMIKLAVAVLYSTAPDPAPDPIIYLEGGPGGSALTGLWSWVDSPLRARRDIILLDQRGTGYSDPFLGCYEGIQACHQRLVEEGIDLSKYNSAASADDITDLRMGLGIKHWNVIGISYGTRLALTLLRDHPQGVRSVVLDSVYPPQAKFFERYSPNAVRAFSALFESCANDPACDRAYPDLEGVFYRLVAAWNFSPAPMYEGDSGSDDDYEWDLTGDDLASVFFDALYDTTLIPYLPMAIYEAQRGNAGAAYDLMTGAAFYSSDEESYEDGWWDEDDVSQSDGMHHSVECHEEMPFNDQDYALQGVGRLPEALRRGLTSHLQSSFALCETWAVEDGRPIEGRPVVSKVPALVLAGRFDPITPPEWSEQAANHLSNSHYFLFPNAGHGILGSSLCADDIYGQFIDDPTISPDAACIADLSPRFKIR